MAGFIGGGSIPGTVFMSAIEVDATLAANLPANPSNGQTHRISVAGDFGDSTLIQPRYFDFEAGDYIKFDANLGKWCPVIGNADIDDTAYGAGWNGDTLNAPSRNRVYEKFQTLGTMSTQNANNVAITGGSINGATLGATTVGVTAAPGTNSTHLATTAFAVSESIKAAIVLG